MRPTRGGLAAEAIAMMIPLNGGLMQAPVMVAQILQDVDGFLTGPQVFQAVAELLLAVLTSLLYLIFPSLRGGA
ncbi:MAG: hypothetical protein HOP29_07115 [Phycisphaerales bacterium]|nr:hypothetical protein [Phycisphaerales bacterium]